MTSLGFTDFKEKLISGEKRQTVRKLRKRPIKLGEKLHLFWHLRRKDCELLRVEVCKETFFVTMWAPQFIRGQYFGASHPAKGVLVFPATEQGRRWSCNSWTWDQIEHLAVLDGFKGAFEMLKALSKMHGLREETVFQVIRW